MKLLRIFLCLLEYFLQRTVLLVQIVKIISNAVIICCAILPMKLTFQGLLIHLPLSVRKLENTYFLYCLRDDSKMEANRTIE